MADETVGLLRVVLASDSAGFTAGMDKADAALGAFSRSAQSVGRSLANMVRDFDGTKIATEAAKTAAAIEKVGGVSSLTDAELGRVTRTLDAAAAKFRQLGQDVPPHIAKLQNEISALDRTSSQAAAPSGGLGMFQGALGQIGKFLPGLTVGAAVAGVVALGRAALESADRLVTLAERTGVSTEEVQRWEYVASMTGTTAEAFAGAAMKMGVNVANGTDKVRAAVGQLRLGYAELRDMKPEDQFATVIARLEGVESVTERNRIGQALFGKQFSEIAVAVAEGYSKIAQQANITKDAQVRAAEAAGEAWDRMRAKIAAAALGVVGRLSQEMLDTAASVDSLNEAQLQEYRVLQKLGTGYQYLLQVHRERMDAMKETAKLQAHAPPPPIKEQTDYAQALRETNAAAATLRAEHGAQVDAALKLKGATDEVADSFGTTVEILRAYQAQATASSTHTRTLSASKQQAAETAAVLVGWEEKATAETARLAAEQKRAAQAGLEMFLSLSQVTTALQSQAPVLARANTQWIGYAGSVQQNTAAAGASSEGFLGKLKGLFGGGEGGGGKMSELLNTVGPQFAAAFLGPGSAGDKLKAFATQGLGALMAMIPGVGPWLQAFSGPIVEGLSKLAKKAKDILSGIFGGPGADERKGREVVAGFEDELAGVLTAQQQAEAGGEDWKKTVIAIRDAYLAMGRTEEEALADAKRLWESSKQGADAAARVIEEIRQKMKLLTTGTHTIEVEYRERTGPGGGGERDGGNDTQPEDPGHRVGTIGRYGSWFKNFGSGLKTSLHGMEAVLRPQDAMPFAASVIGGTAAESGDALTNNNTSINILPVPVGPEDAYALARAVIGRIPSALGMNEQGLATAIEDVIRNYNRSYRTA